MNHSRLSTFEEAFELIRPKPNMDDPACQYFQKVAWASDKELALKMYEAGLDKAAEICIKSESYEGSYLADVILFEKKKANGEANGK